MLHAVQDERMAALQTLTEREAETSAGREALVIDRAALDSEIGAMGAAVRRQDSHVAFDRGLSDLFSFGTPDSPLAPALSPCQAPTAATASLLELCEIGCIGTNKALKPPPPA